MSPEERREALDRLEHPTVIEALLRAEELEYLEANGRWKDGVPDWLVEWSTLLGTVSAMVLPTAWRSIARTLLSERKEPMSTFVRTVHDLPRDLNGRSVAAHLDRNDNLVVSVVGAEPLVFDRDGCVDLIAYLFGHLSGRGLR